MKAVRFHQHGGPEVLRYEDVPGPVAGPGEAVVRVRACALNHLDLWERRGIERVPIPLPHISGSDIAGELLSIGPSRPIPLSIGQRVLLQPGLSCGVCRFCQRGDDNLCPDYDVLGYKSNGGYAELVKAPIANVIPIPDTVAYVEAAAFPVTFVTAWHMLVTRGVVRPGEDVLVLGAGSGVGQAAIQIAKVHGARVITTVGARHKVARARELGADHVVNLEEQDFLEEVRRLTNREGVDLVIEHVGEATWAKSIRSLKRGGRLVTCGATTGHDGRLDLRVLFARQLSLLGSYMGTRGELLEAARFFFAGRIKPVVDRVFKLAEAADAQRYLEARQQFGKVVLEC